MVDAELDSRQPVERRRRHGYLQRDCDSSEPSRMAYWSYELSLESSLWTFLKTDVVGLFLSFALDYYYLSHLRNLTSPMENRSLNKSNLHSLHDKYMDYQIISCFFPSF